MKTKTIWKFPVQLKDEFDVEMPLGARVLTVQLQHGEPRMWVLVDADAPETAHRFRLAGTGHPIKDADTWIYVGTFQIHGGSLVFHLFHWPSA